MHNKVKYYFKKEYDLTATYDEDLSLYGFTNITTIDNKIFFASLSVGSGHNFVFYRIIDPVHYHHIEKLERLRTAINEPKYKQKLFREKRAKRAMDWFRKVHTEVYTRKRELA